MAISGSFKIVPKIKPLKVNNVSSQQEISTDPKVDQLLSVVSDLAKQMSDLHSEMSRIKSIRNARRFTTKCVKCIEDKSERCKFALNVDLKNTWQGHALKISIRKTNREYTQGAECYSHTTKAP